MKKSKYKSGKVYRGTKTQYSGFYGRDTVVVNLGEDCDYYLFDTLCYDCNFQIKEAGNDYNDIEQEENSSLFADSYF